MKRINIFGTSERIKELGDDKINRLLKLKTPSIGINYFPIKYSDVDYWMFNDGQVVEDILKAGAYKGQRIITNNYVYDTMLKGLNWNIECTFEPNSIQNHVGNSGWTALWWAVKEGYKHAYLYGVLDGEYTTVASGDTIYKNFLTEQNSSFQGNKYQKFKNDVESNFNGKIKICRPLLKSLGAVTELMS